MSATDRAQDLTAGFTIHLFISYAHLDNQPLLGLEVPGWITRFHEYLEPILNMRVRHKTRIWRDTKLRGNDVFGDEIVQQFPKTALFVSIMTPTYIESEWCRREIETFYQTANDTGGVVIGNKSRIFKVIKTPVQRTDLLPPIVQDTLGYEFYLFEDENPLELDPAFGAEHRETYLRKLNAIAWDIARMLEQLGVVSPSRKALELRAQEKPTIYLAECSYDRRKEREIIASELKAHGYTVLPQRRLPDIHEAYIFEVQRLLAQSNLSIHLIGESYGRVPDGSTDLKSNVVLQHELAVEQGKVGELCRVVWLPAGTQSQHESQAQFIQAITQQAEFKSGAVPISGDLEDLKAVIHARLKEIEKPKSELVDEDQSRGSGYSQMIYLICDERDRTSTRALRKYLRNQGYKVNVPLFSGNAAAVFEADKTYLTNCDAILLFYGCGDEAWLFNCENALRKMKAYRGDTPLPVVYTYIAEPETFDKEDRIAIEDYHMINALDGFSEDKLTEFIQALKARRQVT